MQTKQAKRLAFNLKELPKRKRPVVPIVMAGQYWRGDTKSFEVTPDDFKIAQRNALERGLPLTIDCNHTMEGPSFGHVDPASWFVEDWQPSQFAFKRPVLFGEVDWKLKGKDLEELLDKYPFISPVIMFNARRMMSTKLGEAGDPIGMFIERISLVDSPFFPMPMVIPKSANFSVTAEELPESGYLFDLSGEPVKGVNNSQSEDSRRFGMSGELSKAITDVLKSGKGEEEMCSALMQIMYGYSRTHVERYTTTYVAAYNAIGIEPPKEDEAEKAGERLAGAILNFKAQLDSAKEEAKADAMALDTLEKSKVAEKVTLEANAIEFKQRAEKAEGELNKLKADYDTFVFQTNSDLKKHEAIGWDEDTAKVMFQHNRARYDEKMKAAKPVTFNAAPVTAPIAEQPELFANQAPPMSLAEAQLMFTNSYVAEQIKQGRKYDQALMTEAMQFADSQISSGAVQIFQPK